MKFTILVLVMLFMGLLTSFGQNEPLASAGIDLGAGFKTHSVTPSILYHEEAGFHRLPWLKATIGLRAWGVFEQDRDLLSANSTSSERLQFRRISVAGASFVVGALLKFGRVSLGANTDLVCIAYGTNRKAFYPKAPGSSGAGQAYYNAFVTTSPQIFNALPIALVGQNGQSELYGRIAISKSVGLKFGYLVGKVSYTTNKIDDKQVVLDNKQRRFYAAYGMPYAAISFSLSD